jgi:hypothetical protein
LFLLQLSHQLDAKHDSACNRSAGHGRAGCRKEQPSRQQQQQLTTLHQAVKQLAHMQASVSAAATKQQLQELEFNLMQHRQQIGVQRQQQQLHAD